MLVEFVWYFLKSTDLVARRVESDHEFQIWVDNGINADGEVEYLDGGWIRLKYQFDTWLPKVRGGFLPTDVSRVAVAGWAEVQCLELHADDLKLYLCGEIRGPLELLTISHESGSVGTEAAWTISALRRNPADRPCRVQSAGCRST